jgi:hypothetical protein
MPVGYYVRENKLTTPPSYSCQTSAEDAPFNNEYTLSVSTRPTGHGSPRTGPYRRDAKNSA